MIDATYSPTTRRRQIHDGGRVPTRQQPSIPCAHLAGADGRQIPPVAVDLPSPPPEDEQSEELPSPNTALFPPAAVATWTQALHFTGVSPFGQLSELDAFWLSRPDSFQYFVGSRHNGTLRHTRRQVTESCDYPIEYGAVAWTIRLTLVGSGVLR